MNAGWAQKRITDVCDVFADGDWIESKDQSDEGIRLIQTGNVGEGRFKGRNEKARYISTDTFLRLKCTEIFRGDCIISRLPDPVGRSCVLPDTGERMITAVDCTIVRFKPTEVIPEFFVYYTQSTAYLRAVDRACSGATRQRISRANLGSTAIPVPPLAEQKRIVAILDQAFEAIGTTKSNAERNVLNAKELLDRVLSAAFAKRDEMWLDRRLGDVVDRLTNGYVGPTRHIYRDDGIPYLLARHVKDNTLTFDERTYVSEAFNIKHRKSILKEGDVLLVQSGHIGHSAVVPPEHEGHNCHAMIVMSPIKGVLDGQFLSWFFGSSEMKARFQSIHTGSTLQHLNCRDVKELSVPVPPIDVQKRIICEITNIQTRCGSLERLYRNKLTEVSGLRTSLLHHAFTGSL